MAVVAIGDWKGSGICFWYVGWVACFVIGWLALVAEWRVRTRVGLGSCGIAAYRLKIVDDFASGVSMGEARATQDYWLLQTIHDYRRSSRKRGC